MFAFALALVVTWLLVAAVKARPPRARITIRGLDETVELRPGRRLQVVNGDIRPQRLIDPDGSVVCLDRPGAACVLRFDDSGTYTLDAYAGASLVPGIGTPGRNATIRVVVR